MDLSKQFSFTDFLAYLFPGITTVLGLYVILMDTPVKKALEKTTLDLTSGILFLVISYVLGVIISGFSRNLLILIEKLQHYKDVRKTMPFTEFQEEIFKAFQELFGNSQEAKSGWTRNHYYLCQALVLEKMPAIGLRAERQSNISLFRRNLIMPILIWMLSGITWGISLINSNSIFWGSSLIIFALIASIYSLKTTVERLHDSEVRETREVLLGFLAGYKIKLFSPKD